MSFQQFKLTKSINQSRGIFDKYIYNPDNDDVIIDILTDGYFSQSRYIGEDGWLGGIIEVIAVDGFAIVKINDIGVSRLYDSTITPTSSLSEGQVPKSDVNGNFIYSGATVNPTTEEWTFDKSIEVPQASVKISDTLSISEATLLAITRDKVQSTNVVNVGSAISDIPGSSKLVFQHVPSIQHVIAQPDDSVALTTNPLVVPLLSTLANQTDIVTLRTGSPMNNFRATIVDNLTGITLKYIPSKAVVVAGVGGLDLPAGDAVFNFNSDDDDVPASGLFFLGFTPLRQSAGQASTFTIFADTMDILGEAGGIPYIENDIHFLESTTVPFIEDVTNLADPYTRLNNTYTGLSGTTGGPTVNYLATSTTDTISAGQFTIGDAGTSNPTVETVTGNIFTQDDLVQINGTVLNDGLYEVEDHAGVLLTLKGVGTVPKVEDFTESDFITTVDTGTVTKVNVSVMRAGVDGKWEQGKGSSTPLTFAVVDLFGSEYQFESDETESTTTDMTFVNKLTLTTPSIPAGNYRGSITCAITNDTNNKVVTIETVLDGNNVNESSFSPRNGGDFIVKTVFSNDTITSGAHTLDLNFKAGGTGGTAKIKNARIEIFRVS